MARRHPIWLTTTVDPGLKEAVRETAGRLGLSVSHTIRAALLAYVAANKHAPRARRTPLLLDFEPARRRGGSR